MTINTSNSRNEYTATVGQTIFTYSFRCFAATDIRVFKTASGATPNDNTDEITAFSVTGVGNVNGGTIVLNTGAAASDKITIILDQAIKRTENYQYNGDFLPADVNTDIDYQTNSIKRLDDKISRVPHFDESVQGVRASKLPKPVVGSFLRWKTTTGEIENVTLTTGNTATDASSIAYSNTTSGLDAVDVQGAIDEIVETSSALNNPLAYGAVGDGVTDDSVAIQAAINAASKDGTYTVEFPAKHFAFASTLYTYYDPTLNPGYNTDLQTGSGRIALLGKGGMCFRDAVQFTENIGTVLEYTGTTGRGIVTGRGDDSLVKRISISTAADNGSGLIRIKAPNHGLSTSDSVRISGVVGTTEANADWTVTVIDNKYVDLQGSTFVNAYVSGGYIYPHPILGTSNVGGLIRINAVNHGLVSGDMVFVQDVGGTVEANNAAGTNWLVTKFDNDNFDLIGSSYVNTYTSGGTYYQVNQTSNHIKIKDMTIKGETSGILLDINSSPQHSEISGLFVWNKGRSAAGVACQIRNGFWESSVRDCHFTCRNGTTYLAGTNALIVGVAGLSHFDNITCSYAAIPAEFGTITEPLNASTVFTSIQAREGGTGMRFYGGTAITIDGLWIEQNEGACDLIIRGSAENYNISGAHFVSTLLTENHVQIGDNTGDMATDYANNIIFHSPEFGHIGGDTGYDSAIKRFAAAGTVVLNQPSFKNNGGNAINIDEFGYTLNVVDCVDNGAGLCRVKVYDHKYKTDDRVTTASIGGIPGANGTFYITYVDKDNFDLQGTSFAGPYVSGGTSIKYSNAPFIVNQPDWFPNDADSKMGSAKKVNSSAAKIHYAMVNGGGDDVSSVNPSAGKTITNAISGTAGVVRLTATAHGFSTGNIVGVSGVTGTTEANGGWMITKVDNDNFELDGSTFVNAYVSGGTTSASVTVDMYNWDFLPPAIKFLTTSGVGLVRLPYSAPIGSMITVSKASASNAVVVYAETTIDGTKSAIITAANSSLTLRCAGSGIWSKLN